MSKKAFNEVLELLKYIPIKDYLKIPRKVISKIMIEKDENYEFIYDMNKDVSDQNISREALIIFVNLYYKYIANAIQKKKIKEILEINYKLNKRGDINA